MADASDDITRLLARAHEGDTEALQHLVPLVYEELRTLAHQQRRRQRGTETLNTTAIVHEAYERLVRSDQAFADRGHFFRIAARAMRNVVIDHARAQHRQKRGDGLRPLHLDEVRLAPPTEPERLLALDEALSRLQALDARQAEIVELRYFVGLTIAETAEVLALSDATVKRDWAFARAWLRRALAA